MVMSAAAVFVAGLLTFVSPCVLPLIPIYLSILSGGGGEGGGRFRGFVSSLAFAAGFTLVFSLLGLSATVLGRALVDHKVLFQQLGGFVVLLLGLRFMGYLKLPGLDGGGGLDAGRFKTRFHHLNSFVLGLFFAFAWSPCIGSVLGAVLTYTSLKTSDPLVGMGYLSLYSLGFAVPLVLVALVAGPALAALRKVRRFIPIFEKSTGLLLVVVGFLLATDRLGLLDYALAQPPEAPMSASAEEPPEPSLAMTGELPSSVPLAGARPAEGATCGGGDEHAAAIQCGSAQEPLPVLYEFYSPNCPICRQMMPAVNVLRNQCNGHPLEIRQVDVTSPEGKPLAQKFGIGGIPVFVYQDRDRKEVARLVGYQTLDSLRQAAEVVSGEECPAYREVPGLR
jgi:cytochrome c-type biogenesis protein